MRPKLEVERVELSNGLVLLLSPNSSNPSAAINAVVLAGSRLEPDAKAGLASLVGDLISEGTRSRTAKELAETVESVGGRLSTSGDYQSSGVHANFLSKHIGLGINITADMLMNATFPEEKVALHTERRVAQIRSRLDVPRVRASDVFNELVFEGHPQHRPPIGYEQTVRGLLRQDMVEFYERFYTPYNAIIAISGQIDSGEVRRQVEDAFSAWPATGSPVSLEPIAAARAPAADKFVSVPKEQVNIFIGNVGIDRRNPDYYPLLVLDTILGSSPGFTSRIPRVLRDQQGLAYSTFSNITSSAGIDPGRFVAYIGTSPESLERALSGLRSEIKRIVDEPVTQDELEGAQSYLTGNFVFDFQTNAQVAQFLVEAEVYGLGFDYLERYPELIRSVSVEAVTQVARRYINPDQLVTVVVGPVDGRGRVIKEDRKSED